MSILKNTVVGLTFLAMGAGLLGNAKAQDKSAAPVYIENQKVEGNFKHALPIPDLFAGQSGGGHYRVRASRHDDPTEVEIHTQDTDVFYVTSGSSTFVAGGTCADAKETTPNELRGKSIEALPPISSAKGTSWWSPTAFPISSRRLLRPRPHSFTWRLRFVRCRMD